MEHDANGSKFCLYLFGSIYFSGDFAEIFLEGLKSFMSRDDFAEGYPEVIEQRI